MSAAERAEKLAELDAITEQTIGPATALPRLVELLSDEDADVRAQAAAAAWSYPAADEVAGRLLELAGDDAVEAVRAAALGSLGRIIREGDLAGARHSGYAPQPELDEPAAERFAAARDLLMQAVEREEGDARRRAALSLAYLADEPAVVAAIDGLLAAGDEASRAAALRCMGRGGDPRWRERIREAVEEGDAGPVGEAAVWAAGASEVVGLAPLLARILKAKRQPLPLRLAAAQALGSLGKDAAAALLEVADDPHDDEEVRAAARAGLESLTLLGEQADAQGAEVTA